MYYSLKIQQYIGFKPKVETVHKGQIRIRGFGFSVTNSKIFLLKLARVRVKVAQKWVEGVISLCYTHRHRPGLTFVFSSFKIRDSPPSH